MSIKGCKIENQQENIPFIFPYKFTKINYEVQFGNTNKWKHGLIEGTMEDDMDKDVNHPLGNGPLQLMTKNIETIHLENNCNWIFNSKPNHHSFEEKNMNNVFKNKEKENQEDVIFGNGLLSWFEILSYIWASNSFGILSNIKNVSDCIPFWKTYGYP